MPKKEKEVKEKKQKNSYFKEMKAELKKVVWPTPKELLNTTASVLAFVIIIAVIVFVLDFCFDAMNKYGITKLQGAIQSSFSKEEDTNSTSEGENANTEATEGNEESTENLVEVNGTAEDSTESEGEENATE